MNKNPSLLSEHAIQVNQESQTCSVLFESYGGPISTDCLELLAREWNDRKKDPITIKIYEGFENQHNVHDFCFGFEYDKRKLIFRQATIVELLTLGAQEQNLGLKNFVYCLGSVSRLIGKTICGAPSDMMFFPGLESMDGKRQMLARAIDLPWGKTTQVALVELKD